MRKREIYVWGYIHNCGGAGPELLHQIELWLMNGVEIHLVVDAGTDVLVDEHNPRREWCNARGIHTHMYEPGIFRDKVVISFCQDEFMNRLPQIVADGKPRLVIWFNCMTWNHGHDRHDNQPPTELSNHASGLIDMFGFQSEYQRGVLTPKLEEAGGKFEVLEGYVPYFHLANDFHAPRRAVRNNEEKFRIGRISRDDPDKFPPNLWQLVSLIHAPKPVHFWIVGLGGNASAKIGSPESDPIATSLDRRWWDYCYDSSLISNEFWPHIDLLFHYWDQFRENYPRALLEAMAAGVPIVCNNTGGNPEIVQDGHSGFCVNSDAEAIFRASQLACDPELYNSIAENAYQALLDGPANAERAWQAWAPIL